MWSCNYLIFQRAMELNFPWEIKGYWSGEEGMSRTFGGGIRRIIACRQTLRGRVQPLSSNTHSGQGLIPLQSPRSDAAPAPATHSSSALTHRLHNQAGTRVTKLWDATKIKHQRCRRENCWESFTLKCWQVSTRAHNRPVTGVTAMTSQPG